MLLANPDKFSFRLRTLKLPFFLKKPAVFLSSYLQCIFSIFPYLYLIDWQGANTQSRPEKPNRLFFAGPKDKV